MHLAQRDELFQSQALWAGAYKNRTNQPRQIEWAQFFIKILGANFGNYILDNSNLDKIIEGRIKKIHIWNRVRISLKGKKIIVNQILLSK